MKLSEELQWRGFWNQTTFTDDKLIDSENFTLYLGTDPSADSLHVGHLAVYMMVRHFLERGHKVFLLVGGGTGMIGDMRDTEERNLLPYEEIEHNKQALKSQVSRILLDEILLWLITLTGWLNWNCCRFFAISVRISIWQIW